MANGMAVGGTQFKKETFVKRKWRTTYDNGGFDVALRFIDFST